MRSLFLSITASIFILTGCTDGACCTKNELVQTKSVKGDLVDEINKTPIAIISNLPTHVENCSNVNAIGELSHDLDGTVESYMWSVDDINTSEEQNPNNILPCENNQTRFQVCLNVTDNEGASSIPTCQIVYIVSEGDIEEPSDSNHSIPTIDMPVPTRDGNEFVFNVCDQTYDGHEIQSYYWQVTKHFKDGATATHTNDTCEKRIFAEIKEFETVDVTLTITFSDGHSSTTTNSYIMSDNAQTLD